MIRELKTYEIICSQCGTSIKCCKHSKNEAIQYIKYNGWTYENIVSVDPDRYTTLQFKDTVICPYCQQ